MREKKKLYKIRPKGWKKFIDVYVLYEHSVYTHDERHFIYYLKCKERCKKRYLLYWDNEEIVVSSELGKLSKVQFKIIARIFTEANNLKGVVERYLSNKDVREIENQFRPQKEGEGIKLKNE